MLQANGISGVIRLQKEATFKTDPAVPAMVGIPFESEALRGSRKNIESTVITGNRNPTKPAAGNTDVAGNIVTELGATLGRLLEGVMGAVSSVTNANGTYTYTYTIGNSLPSYTMEKGFTDIAQFIRYSGCVVNKMGFNVTPSGFQKTTFDIIGAKEHDPTTVSFHPGAVTNAKVSFDGFSITTVEEGGAAIAEVAEIKNFSIENQADNSNYLIGSGGERAGIPPGLVKVGGTLSAIFADTALYMKAKARTESSLHVVYSFGTGDGTVGNEKLDILVPQLVYSPEAPTIPGPKGIFVELPFTAYFNGNPQGTALQITLTCAIAPAAM